MICLETESDCGDTILGTIKREYSRKKWLDKRIPFQDYFQPINKTEFVTWLLAKQRECELRTEVNQNQAGLGQYQIMENKCVY